VNKVYVIPPVLVLVIFCVTTQTTHGIGLTLWPNGSVTPSDVPPGSTVGPVNITKYPNGDFTASAQFNMGPDPKVYIAELTGNPHRSQAWNSGYAEGFLGLGLPLEDHHTTDFFYGYTNGTEFFQFDKAYANALSFRPADPPHWGWIREHQYHNGHLSGIQDRIWMWTNASSDWAKQKYSPLPATTKDNYMHYYVGFDNGAWAADAENQNATVFYHGNCGVGYTDEYCTGFKAGWNYEANALGPPPSASSSNVTPTASKV
jgi:hypothetical protein